MGGTLVSQCENGEQPMDLLVSRYHLSAFLYPSSLSPDAPCPLKEARLNGLVYKAFHNLVKVNLSMTLSSETVS